MSDVPWIRSGSDIMYGHRTSLLCWRWPPIICVQSLRSYGQWSVGQVSEFFFFSFFFTRKGTKTQKWEQFQSVGIDFQTELTLRTFGICIYSVANFEVESKDRTSSVAFCADAFLQKKKCGGSTVDIPISSNFNTNTELSLKSFSLGLIVKRLSMLNGRTVDRSQCTTLLTLLLTP